MGGGTAGGLVRMAWMGSPRGGPRSPVDFAGVLPAPIASEQAPIVQITIAKAFMERLIFLLLLPTELTSVRVEILQTSPVSRRLQSKSLPTRPAALRGSR